MLLLTTALSRAAEVSTDEQLMQAAEGYRLSDLRRFLPALPDNANRSYFSGKLALAEYRHADADKLSARCKQQARTALERSRCAELGAEATAMAMAITSDDLARLRMLSTLRARLDTAVQSDARNVRARQLLARFYRITPWYLGGGGEAAKRTIQIAVALAPNRGDELRGIDAYDAQQWSGAIGYLQRVVARDGNRAEAAYYLALADDKNGDRRRAISVLTTTVAAHPEFWDAQFQLGTLSLDSDPAFAAQVLTRFSAAVTPGVKRLASAWYSIGSAEEKLGHGDAALRAYRTALRYKPGHNESQAAVQRLSRGARRS